MYSSSPYWAKVVEHQHGQQVVVADEKQRQSTVLRKHAHKRKVVASYKRKVVASYVFWKFLQLFFGEECEKTPLFFYTEPKNEPVSLSSRVLRRGE